MRGWLATTASERLDNTMTDTMSDPARLDTLCITALRPLSVDAVQKANSGHPGTPMGTVPTAHCHWQRYMRKDCEWTNRDGFVPPAGPASALVYSRLFLCGVATNFGIRVTHKVDARATAQQKKPMATLQRILTQAQAQAIVDAAISPAPSSANAAPFPGAFDVPTGR